MTLNRREFIKATAIAGGAYLLHPSGLFGNHSNAQSNYFTVHPFIEANPDAVFIMLTNVDVKTNSDAVKQAGLKFGKTVFQLTSDAEVGVPLGNTITIKPNLTSRGAWQSPSDYTVEGTMGVITDVYFTEGIIETFLSMGISSDQIYIREVNGTENLTEGGYGAMAERTGADVQVLTGNYSDDQLQWLDVPDGVWFDKIPYLWPMNAPNSWLLNIAKFKTHSMGLTLCAKNLQGTIAAPYQQHCNDYYAGMNIPNDHIKVNAKNTIMANYQRHQADGVPRWDVSGSNHLGALGMETWISRCLDNNSVTKPGLHVVEGVYGRDGDFVVGPNDGFAKDYMTNVIIFGKNPFYVDIVGHWLGGHEPGNFGLFHVAQERGFIDKFDPMAIPVYEWSEDGQATRAELSSFDRYALKTKYLQKPDEDLWHIVDEPYEYAKTGVTQRSPARPQSYILEQNYPNPFNPTTTIYFSIPDNSYVRLEIFNSRGEIVDVLHDKFTQRGNHTAVWNARNLASGIYFYRFRCGSFSQTKKMTLIR